MSYKNKNFFTQTEAVNTFSVPSLCVVISKISPKPMATSYTAQNASVFA